MSQTSTYSTTFHNFNQPYNQAYFHEYQNYYNNSSSTNQAAEVNSTPVVSQPVLKANDSLPYEEKQSDNENKENEVNTHLSPVATKSSNDYPIYFTTQRMCQNTVKLSYTMFQKSLLESVYRTMKYPNSDQKTILSEKLGISRDQLKIWFQNRRRKDVLVHTSRRSKRSRPSDETEYDESNSLDNDDDASPNQLNKRPMIEDDMRERHCIDGVLGELKLFENGPSRLTKKSSCNKNSKGSDSEEKSFQKFEEEAIPVVGVPISNEKHTLSESYSLFPALNTSSTRSVSSASTSTSLTLSSSSGSSSSSSSDSSSAEEKANQEVTSSITIASNQLPHSYQNKEVYENFNFNTVKQTYSMHDYVNNMRSNASASFKYPKIHYLDSNPAAVYRDQTNSTAPFSSNEHHNSYYYPTVSYPSGSIPAANYSQFNQQFHYGNVHYSPASYYPPQYSSTVNNTVHNFVEDYNSF
jgi:hypothetical protein